jgi:Mrp family chromosome partitioning ATPase
MSRNFELLTQIQAELGDAAVLSAAATPARTQAAIPRQHASDAMSEEMVRLVQLVFLSGNGSAPRKVLFCGVDEGCASSSVCARTGRLLAERSARSVCLVDANLHSPRLSDIFGVDTTAQCDSVPLPERCAKVGAHLWLAGANVLAGGKRAFAGVNELKEAVTRLREEFEYVLIDVAGASPRGDAALLGQVTDATILVIEAHETRRVAARKAKETLDAANVRVLGTVLHNRTFPIPEQLYRKL